RDAGLHEHVAVYCFRSPVKKGSTYHRMRNEVSPSAGPGRGWQRREKCASLKGKNRLSISFEGGFMTSMTCSPVQIQTSPQSVPSTPSWFGEVALMAHYLSQRGLLEQIEERVRFASARFGVYATIELVFVPIAYALS